MGLFSAKRFMPTEISTVYFSPKKDNPKYNTYTMQHFKFYFSVSNRAPLFTGARFMNDATCKCTQSDKECLMKKNNEGLSGCIVKAKYVIE